MRHIPIIESEPIANPPSTKYERGKWYERRGYWDKALESFKEAAQSTPGDSANHGWKEVDLSWLEYGILSMRMRSFRKSEEAFRTVLHHRGTHAQEALNQWAALMLVQGIQDQVIYERLLEETHRFSSSDIMVGRALYFIGSYSLAARCFSTQETLEPDHYIQYISCLILTKQTQEAVLLLDKMDGFCHSHDTLPVWRVSERERAHILRIRQLCEWRLCGTPPDIGLPIQEVIELAGAAISLGMISEAEELLAARGDHAYYALIVLLYREGYRGLALTKLNQLEALPLQDRDTYSMKVCFIAAENLYDQGLYDEAAVMLDQLRHMSPENTAVRFGEAACYLQSALISLSIRMEEHYSSSNVKQEIELYMDRINAALHVVENTHWHTAWSPAQQRLERSSGTTSFLN